MSAAGSRQLRQAIKADLFGPVSTARHDYGERHAEGRRLLSAFWLLNHFFAPFSGFSTFFRVRAKTRSRVGCPHARFVHPSFTVRSSFVQLSLVDCSRFRPIFPTARSSHAEMPTLRPVASGGAASEAVTMKLSVGHAARRRAVFGRTIRNGDERQPYDLGSVVESYAVVRLHGAVGEAQLDPKPS